MEEVVANLDSANEIIVEDDWDEDIIVVPDPMENSSETTARIADAVNFTQLVEPSRDTRYHDGW